MQDDGISVNKNALENTKIHRLVKICTGRIAATCSGPGGLGPSGCLHVLEKRYRGKEMKLYGIRSQELLLFVR